MATLKDNESFQIDLIEVGNVLSQYKVELEELLKRKIMDKNSVASGDLLASIHTRLEVNGTSFEVWLDCLKYLKFLDQGTKPHWMPEEPIIKWIKDKKLPTREYTGSDSLPTEKQLGFLIRRKIANEDWAYSNFLLLISNAPAQMHIIENTIQYTMFLPL